MMSIEEAIIHAEKVAKREEGNAKQYDNAVINQRNEFDAELCRSGAKSCRKCAAEHRQLASWLKELKVIHDEIDSMSDYDEIFIGYLRKKMKEVI